ncbi:MAG: division/cell wall cluster transcriptional repressor MraZ [Phycisphaerales bacterium JB059]
MPFTGQAEAIIDAKQRLAIPAKFRTRWDPERDGSTWYCVPWPQDGVLRLYTERQFESMPLAQGVTNSLTPDQNLADLQTAIYGNSEQLNVDANNRIRLQAWHLELVAMPKDVMVIGAGDRLEIRSREAWMRERQQRFADLRRLVDQRERPPAP